MGTRQTTVRFAERTDQQLAELATLFGDRTKAIAIAVDRLYYDEITVPERITDYNREQATGHAERQERMRAEGRPWYPTNKRQFPKE